MSRRRRRVLALLIGAGITFGGVAVTTLVTGAPGTATKPVPAPDEEGRVVVKEEDVSTPGETLTGLAFVNGRYWPVKDPVKRFKVTYSNGDVEEKIVQDNSHVQEQLPPQDPALAGITPTVEQAKAAAAEYGVPYPDD